MDNNNYYDNPAISYSLLRNLSISPSFAKKAQEEEQEDKEHFTIGSGVDLLLTEPDKFWQVYALEYKEICEVVPTGQMKMFIDYLFQFAVDDEESHYQRAYNEVGFKRESLEKVIERFEKEGKPYYDWLCRKRLYDLSIENKQILTTSQYDLITRIVESLKTNRFTRKYFEGTTGKNIEVFNQLEIYWEFKGQKCKSKLDLVIVDHDSKEIQAIDIKTTGNSPFSFNSSSLKWRYDLQASFYSTALYWLLMMSNDEKWTKYKDYDIKPFKFIVESSKYPGLPLIYECSDKYLIGGAEGFEKDGKRYKGFQELINEYKWCCDNNDWSYPKEVIEKEGIIELNYG